MEEKKQEKTAIELIYEMHSMMEKMSQELTLLKTQVSLLDSKANGEFLAAVKGSMDKQVQPRDVKPVATENAPEVQEELPPPPRPELKPSPVHNRSGQLLKKPKNTRISPDRLKENNTKQRNPNTRVFGKFSDNRGRPVFDIYVSIYDSANNLIKETRTNRAGEFNSFLPPGDYSAEFLKEGMAPQFKSFKVMPGQQAVQLSL